MPKGGAFLGALATLLCAVHDGRAQSTADAPRPPSTNVATTDRFEFHSDPWLNLHHFLYHWVRDDEGLGSARQRVSVPERSALGQLSDSERAAWLNAVTFYRQSVANRSHFDPGMLRQKRALLELGGDLETEAVPDEIPGIAAALTVAMPVYRSQWWPDHDRANRAWIATAEPFVRRHEARYVDMTRRIYDVEWSEAPRRADVSAYANARAGYTAEGHIVIYSTDVGNQALYGVETLFHEIQHTREVGATARVQLATAFEVAGIDQPENLWHSLIFATAGAFVQSIAEQENLPEHVPYWIREGFDGLQGWRPLVFAVHEHWLPVVRGDASKEEGLAALVSSFRSP
jgi:hypothetical protein